MPWKEEQEVSIFLVEIVVGVDGTGAGLESGCSLIVMGEAAVLAVHSCIGNLGVVPEHSARVYSFSSPIYSVNLWTPGIYSNPFLFKEVNMDSVLCN